MPSPMLQALLKQRDDAIQYVTQLTENAKQADGSYRDLVPTEQETVKTTQERITQLDAQIEPLAAFEKMQDDHSKSLAVRGGGDVQRHGLGDGGNMAGEYKSAGQFIVDKIIAEVGWEHAKSQHAPRVPDRAAAARVEKAVANQITSDTPGLLPKPIVGAVFNDIDARRPFMTSIGIRPLPNGQGKVFSRPKITQHTNAGEQTAEKTELVSRKMTIAGVDFTRRTFGGTLNVSRQEIDWTSPEAWEIIVRDLGEMYGLTVENIAADEWQALVTATEAVATDDVKGWVTAIYAAAAKVYTATGRMPDTIWTSVDMWAKVGAMIDLVRLGQQQNRAEESSSPRSFQGMIIDLPRVVVPSLADGTVIVGWSGGFEIYEQRIGLLQVVEPSILGVEIATGGYAAWGMMNAGAFVKLTAPAPPPLAPAPEVIESTATETPPASTTTAKTTTTK